MENAKYIAANRKSDNLVNDVSMSVVSNLESLVNRVFSAACYVEIALRAKESDVAPSEPKLAQSYLFIKEPLWRIYIGMKDSARLSHPYVTSVYENIVAVNPNATKA
ncbi:hypothetical protein DPMN_066894 [Dreissena polymorpha]|uniref:Uncharacterized protein n=1 Tax=Dreissena polymorpha TaxID=45954 RepID=A0A9D3YY93_DREPO|nr:hypothetical protein DPMN_066894 [Dreissena polymorpha]